MKLFCMFYGKYIPVRKSLDYTFHKVYPKERQLLQDEIISHYLTKHGSIAVNPDPRLILTAGAMGAGKTHVVKEMLGDEYKTFVIADVDKIKHRMPEMKGLLQDDPENAGKILHSEACTMHEIIFKQAILSGQNVIIDGSLRNGDFFKDFLQIVKDSGSHQITIVHVIASLETCLRHAEKRSKETGRIVPVESIKLSIEKCPKSVEMLKPLVHCLVTVNTNTQNIGETHSGI